MDIEKLPTESISGPTAKLRPVSNTHVEELAKSIASSGLLQPIMVRPDGDKYQLIFGLHRLMACRSLGWSEVPAVVRQMDLDEVVLLRVVENIQRNTSMDVLEEGKVYQTLLDRGWSVSRVSASIGKSDSYVLDRLRAVDRLRPDIAREATTDPHLKASHAIRIAYIDDQDAQLELADLVKAQKLSVRELERIVALYKSLPLHEIGLNELMQRFKAFNLGRWQEGVFLGPSGRVAIIRAENFDTILDGLGDRARSIGYDCGRSTLMQLIMSVRRGRPNRNRVLSTEKRVREFNTRTGLGNLSVRGGTVELQKVLVRKPEFVRGYLEGFLSVNLKTVIQGDSLLVFRAVRRRVYAT